MTEADKIMTEADKIETSNGNSEQNGSMSSLDKDIIKQVRIATAHICFGIHNTYVER